jgi:hypothetical protein
VPPKLFREDAAVEVDAMEEPDATRCDASLAITREREIRGLRPGARRSFPFALPGAAVVAPASVLEPAVFVIASSTFVSGFSWTAANAPGDGDPFILASELAVGARSREGRLAVL